jgi:hypothetical protein
MPVTSRCQRDDILTDGCTNPGCKAKKRYTHTTDNCYWPGGGKEGQFPPNFGQRTRANAVKTSNEAMEHFILSARTLNTPGESGVLVNDENHSDMDNISAMGLIAKGFQLVL